jgi:hypothetical protein
MTLSRHSLIRSEWMFHFQSWGDHMDVSQAAAVFLFFLGSVCLYCWLGNELSEEVRTIATLKLSLQFNIGGVIQ